MATENFRQSTSHIRGHRRKFAAGAAVSIALSFATIGPAFAQNQQPSGGPLGIDLGLDLSGQGPLLGGDVDLGGLLGPGSGAQVVVTTDPSASEVARIDVSAGAGNDAQAGIGAVIGGDNLVGVQTDGGTNDVDATASVGVLGRNGSIASGCVDVRAADARCGAAGNLLELEGTDVVGVQALALVDGLTGTELASACLDLTLGAPGVCAAAVAPPPANPDPDGPGVPGPGDPGTPGVPSDPSGDPTDDSAVLHAFQSGDGIDAGDETLDGRQVAALAFTGLSVAGLVTLGLTSIGGGTLLTRLRRRTAAEELTTA